MQFYLKHSIGLWETSTAFFKLEKFKYTKLHEMTSAISLSMIAPIEFGAKNRLVCANDGS